MTYKNILVHADASAQCKQRLDVAVSLAREFRAHLSAIYAIQPAIPALMLTPEYFPAELITEQEERERARAKEAKAAFDRYMAGIDIPVEWRQREGILSTVVATNARYADVTIVSQADPASEVGGEAAELAADVALTAGRPVIVVPYIGAPRPIVGAHVLVGWNASREATRAVNDALPLLQRAKKVTVLAIDPERGSGGHGEVPSADIALHLARHGVKAEAAQTVSGDIDVGDAILSRASDFGADLIVLGA
jgi:nucleotide-binding universal stress UspA family protein